MANFTLFKSYTAWLLSSANFLVSILFVLGFYAFHDKVFNSASVVDMNYLTATIVTHVALVFYGGKFIVFVCKPKTLAIVVQQGTVQLGSGASIAMDKAVFRLNRFDDEVVVIRFYHNDKNVLNIDPGYQCPDGFKPLAKQLQSMQCIVEVT